MNNDVPGSSADRAETPVRLVQFEGELRPDLVEALDELTGEGAANVLVDCRRVTSYAEHTLEALAEFERRATEAGGKVMLVGVLHPELQGSVFMGPFEVPAFRTIA